MWWYAQPPPSHLSVVVIRGGGGISCHVRVQAAGIACRSARTWEEPPVNPPSARHGTFAEQGPPTLKACSREQTQHRSALHRAHHLRWQARGSPWWRNTNTHTHTWSGLTCQRDTWTRAHLSGAGRRSVAVPAPLCTARRRTDQFCAVSVLFLKCPVQLRGCCSLCVQQGAPTCRHTWDNPGAQESKWRYRKTITPHFTCQGKSWVIIRQHILNLF